MWKKTNIFRFSEGKKTICWRVKIKQRKKRDTFPFHTTLPSTSLLKSTTKNPLPPQLPSPRGKNFLKNHKNHFFFGEVNSHPQVGLKDPVTDHESVSAATAQTPANGGNCSPPDIRRYSHCVPKRHGSEKKNHVGPTFLQKNGNFQIIREDFSRSSQGGGGIVF